MRHFDQTGQFVYHMLLPILNLIDSIAFFIPRLSSSASRGHTTSVLPGDGKKDMAITLQFAICRWPFWLCLVGIEIPAVASLSLSYRVVAVETVTAMLGMPLSEWGRQRVEPDFSFSNSASEASVRSHRTS